MSDILEDACAELTELLPRLSAALQRDTGSDTTPGTAIRSAAAIVNADVLHAMLTLSRDIPATTRLACETVSEPWQPRDLRTCLRQIPRLTARMHHLGHCRLCIHDDRDRRSPVLAWLRLTKRALGLRKPDLRLPYACPWAETVPENHPGGAVLVFTGAEGFIRHGPDGDTVEWVLAGQIYCPAPLCGARWSESQWPLLERMLATAGAA